MIQFFGTTVTETLAALTAPTAGRRRPRATANSTSPPAAAPPATDVQSSPAAPGDRGKAIIRVIVSFAFILLGTYFVLSDRGDGRRLAVGASLLSLVGGYWLK